MANVRARVHALELADQRMSRLEERVFGHKQDDIPAPDPMHNDEQNIDYDTFVRNPPNPVDFSDIFNDPLSDTLFSNTSSNSPILNSFNISSFNVNGLKTPGQGAFKIDQISSFFSQKHISFGVDLYFKGNIKLRIFVVYIPPTNDLVLRNEVIDHLISLISLATAQNFYHAICGDFNMNLDKYYPIYTQQPQAASQRVHKLFHHLLSHGYEDSTPFNLAPNLGTYHHLDTVTRNRFSKIDARNDNFTNDVSAFIESALSRTRRRIVLDRVFVNHPTRPTLLTSPDAIDKEVIDHFQILFQLLHRLLLLYVTCLTDGLMFMSHLRMLIQIFFGSLMDPPTLEEWSSTISSMPNDKAPGPSMISYEMLKHLGPHASSLLLNLVASHSVLQGGNFAGLPGGSCRDPIITLESIIHDSVVTKHPLWILSQDISKAFDSVDLTMLKFALQRLRLPNNVIQFLLSLFMARSNRVITAHGPHSSYRVRIGIDQGEVISPLLWVIYIDPLLTVLKNEKKDPYSLISPSIPTTLSSGMEHMFSITEEFYRLNNTSANHNKYVLATNAISATQDLAPVVFNLTPSSLNATATIMVTPIPMSSSFRFLGVWFNINGSRSFIRKQLKQECNSFSAILRPAKLTSQQVVYLHNTVLIPKLEYRMQVTHLSKVECSTAASSVRTLVKHKAKLSRSTPDAILYLSQALGYVYSIFIFNSYFSFDGVGLGLLVFSKYFKQDYIACTIASLVSTPFRLSRTNLSSVPDLAYLNGHTPLYQCLSIKIFRSSLHRLRKRGFFYLSQLLTPQGTHLVLGRSFIPTLFIKLSHGLVTKWYQDLPTQFVHSTAKDLIPCIPLVGSKKHWIVTLDDESSPLFGKQLSFQPSRSTCTIAHWISDCSSRPGDLITLKSCPGCDFNMYKSSYMKKPVSIGSVSCACSVPLPESLILPTKKTSITANTSQIVATVSWAEIVDFVTNFIRCHSK
ncbi:unnamed protein product [Rhizophagus irregularis]|nr:unnamed protein product [Rhizophagus irregularis]